MKISTTILKNEPLSRFKYILLFLLTSTTLIFNIIAPILALNWAKQPFLGIFLYPTLVISNSHNSNWQGWQQGLQTADVLQTIDDISLDTIQLTEFLHQKEVGDEVILTVNQDPALPTNRPSQIKLTLTPFSIADLLTFFWLPYGVGLIYLALGLITYQLRGLDSFSLAYIICCQLISIFLAGLFDHQTSHLLVVAWGIAFPLIGASFLHLTYTFPTKHKQLQRNPLVYQLAYLFAGVLGISYVLSIYLLSNPRLAILIWQLIFGLISLTFIGFVVHLCYTYFTVITPTIRQQTLIGLWGSILAFSPAAIWAILNNLGYLLPISWWVYVIIFTPLIIFPLLLTYATLRYRLVDLDIIFSRTAIYVSLTLLVTIAYITIASTLTIRLTDRDIFRDPIMIIVFVIALVVLLGPVREQLQNFVNRRFLRMSIDYRPLLQQYGRELILTPLSIETISEMLAKHIHQALGPKPILVFLRDPMLYAFTVQHHQGMGDAPVEVHFGLSDNLAQWLSDTNDILQLSPDGTLTSKARIHQEELARLNVLQVVLCVPLQGSKRLLGWVSLGLKPTGHPYTKDDLMFLATMASQTTIAMENAQLLKQANQRAAELEALQQISLDVQAEVDPEAILLSIVERAAKLLDVTGGLVWLLEPNSDELRAVVSYNLDRDYTNRLIGKGEGVAGRVLLLGEAVIIDHYQEFSGQSSKFKDAPFGAVLGIPLKWRGKVRGVLNLIRQQDGLPFTERDRWLMSLFASQSAIALEKSQLLEETQHRAIQLTTLSNISRTISSTLDLNTVLPQVMDSAVELLNAEAGSLFLMHPEENALSFEIVLGPTGSELLGAKVPVGVGIAGTVAKTKEPLIINDVSSDPRWNTSFDDETEFKTRDILCIPMIAHDNVVGVIEVINKKDGTTFRNDDVTFLMSFAVQSAIVIENAQIFTRTDKALAERVQELQTLTMFDRELQRSLELDTVLDITLTRAMDALGVAIGAMGIFDNQDNSGFFIPIQYGLISSMRRYANTPWPISKGVMGRVARTKIAALVNDVSLDAEYERKSRSTQSMLIVPVIRDEQIISIINLESSSLNYFTNDDLNFVQLLASHAAIAIENAQLFEQVKTANQAKSEFMNTASHDLKVPMTSIKGYAKMLRIGAGGPLTELQSEFVDTIYKNIDRMSRLVSDLLDVSRIEAGRVRLEIQDVNMQEVIDDVVASLRGQIEAKQQTLELQVEPNLPLLRADYHRLVQLMTNFVSNAYKYTPTEGHITIRAAATTNGDKQESAIEVTIQDTGYGISEEDQAKLFTTFFRSSDQNIRNEPGTGLGLVITKKMIESHGGTLNVHSKLGEGTAFIFTLPLINKIPPGVEVIEK